ncbi:MAG: SET domain-containing protein [Chloroflexi bacterium]|nr:SET domain-containing protein [Chloroflexota bacterium]
MLLVSASIKHSPIHGFGCFTNERIRKGQVVWVLDRRIDVVMPAAQVSTLPEPAQAFLRMYGYWTRQDGVEVVVLCGDHAKHMNHSDEPNLIEGDANGESDVALRDIEAGEELTCNYHHFDLAASQKLGAGAGS